MKKLMLGVALLGGAACGQAPVKVHVGTTSVPEDSTSTTGLIESPTTLITSPPATEPEPEPTTTEAPATTRPRPAARATTTVYVPYVPPESPAPGRAALLACIRSYEQGAAGYATDTGNGFYGAYQFDLQTWGSVGGSGNPAHASPAEQDARAWALYQSRGLQPWPTPNVRCQ